MEIKLTDGGRVAEGFTAEKMDCAVRAFAVALDMPYYQAHDLLAWSGRKDGHPSYHTKDALDAVGLSAVYTRISLARFAKENPLGVFWVHMRGHCFTVKNGVVYDKGRLSPRYIVRAYAEIKGGRV